MQALRRVSSLRWLLVAERFFTLFRMTASRYFHINEKAR
jgi:hypothetical protein